MFERFRNKSAVQEASAKTPVGQTLDQMAFAVAVAKSIIDYVKSRNGVPIIGDKDASVIEIWRGVRLGDQNQIKFAAAARHGFRGALA